MNHHHFAQRRSAAHVGNGTASAQAAADRDAGSRVTETGRRVVTIGE
jgi:hypothetical protein